MAAAQAVALAHSVACEDAVLVTGASNVLVHLRPSPVIARVMTSTAFLHDDVELFYLPGTLWIAEQLGSE